MKSLILGYSLGAVLVLVMSGQVTPGAELIPVTRGPANDSEARYSPRYLRLSTFGSRGEALEGFRARDDPRTP